MMHSRTAGSCIAWTILVCAFTSSAEPVRSIGFRNDGTGVFPDDCRPPTVFDGIRGRNLVWKTPLPNHSNSSPIVVGRKVFVLCAAGWPETRDCAQILCFDAGTGKELWRHDLDEFVAMPDEQAAEARKLRREYHRRIRRLNRLMYEYQSADEARKADMLKEAAGLGAGKKESFDRNGWGTGSAEQAVYRDKEFGDKLRKVCGYSPITWSPTCLDVVMPTPVSDGKRIFVYTGRRAVHAFDLNGNALWHVRQSDAPYNYHWPEDCANAPLIVDGKLVMYVFDHLWAYELDTGRLLWKVQSGVIRHGMGTPVVLRLPAAPKPGEGGSGVEGSVVGKNDTTETAIFTWTGDLVRVRDGRRLLQDVTKVMFGSMVSDGKQMVYASTYGRDNVEAKSIKRDSLKIPLPRKGGVMALRFSFTKPGTAEAPAEDDDSLDGLDDLAEDMSAAKRSKSKDPVTVEQVWSMPQKLGSYPVFRGGRLWLAGGQGVDAKIGKIVAAPKRRVQVGRNGFILAGGYLFGQPDAGINEGSGGASGLGIQKDRTAMCTVVKTGPDRIEEVRQCPIEFLPATITDPAKKAQVVALTGRDRYQDSYGWHDAYSAPFASGNRLFIRTFDALYCFGDKDKPFVPSKAFQAR